MFLNKTKDICPGKSQNSKNPKNRIFRILRKNYFCFVQEHIEKIKKFELKLYFSKLLILNRYVSNLQVPTTSGAPWGKVNVSEFMNFGEIQLDGKNNTDLVTLINKKLLY